MGKGVRASEICADGCVTHKMLTDLCNYGLLDAQETCIEDDADIPDDSLYLFYRQKTMECSEWIRNYRFQSQSIAHMNRNDAANRHLIRLTFAILVLTLLSALVSFLVFLH